VITAWRICKRSLLRSAFSGQGAFLYGGRWNSPGVRMIYAAGSQSLAALEILVHTDDPNDLINLRFVAVPVEIEEALIDGPPKLPKDWAICPAPPSAARMGDLWVAQAGSCVLRVPSAVIRAEWNYLINPAHPNFSRLRIGKPMLFEFDSRLAQA
jgi:RES domain-containing protein